MVCGRCPFFDACRCKSMETGATNGQCQLLKDSPEHTHKVNSKSECVVSPEVRESALYDLVRRQGWMIDTLISQIKGMCMGVDCVAKNWKTLEFEKLHIFFTSIKEHLDKDYISNWRKG